jgi:hypothetical protein
VTVKLLAEKLGSVTLDKDRPIEYVRGNNLTNSGPEHLHVMLQQVNAEHTNAAQGNAGQSNA